MSSIAEVESPSGKALGCWQLLAADYTAIFTDGLDPDPARVRTIRTFDPDYVPLLVQRTFQAPTGGVQTYGYHVIGRFIRDMDHVNDTREPVRLANVPAYWPYPSGTVYAQRTWSLPWAKGSWQYRDGFPEIYLPHDGDLVEWMRACFRQMYGDAESVRAKILRRMKEDAAREEADLERIQAESLGLLKEDHHEFRDAVANELHWLEHPQQRPGESEPKGFAEIHEVETGGEA